MTEERTVRSLAWVMEFNMTDEEYEALCNYEDEAREMLMAEFKRQLANAEYIGTFRAPKKNIAVEVRG